MSAENKHHKHEHSNFSHGMHNNGGNNHKNEQHNKDAKNSKDTGADESAQKNAELEKQIAELKDALMHSLADFENLKKRHSKDLEAMAKYGSTPLLKDIIEPLDKLYIARGIEIPTDLLQNDFFKSFLDGIDMTLQLFEKALAKHGLVRIYPKGEQFNHDIHQAISQIKEEGVEAGTVVQVIQAGYILNGRAIKPALVIVAG